MNIADEMFENLGFEKEIKEGHIGYVRGIKRKNGYGYGHSLIVIYFMLNKKTLHIFGDIETNVFRAIAQKFKELEEQKWKLK